MAKVIWRFSPRPHAGPMRLDFVANMKRHVTPAGAVAAALAEGRTRSVRSLEAVFEDATALFATAAAMIRRRRILLMASAALLGIWAADAVAAQGWYLLAPPLVVKDKAVETSYEAPLWQWEQISAFDTAKDCEAVRLPLIRKAKEDLDKVVNRRLDVPRDRLEGEIERIVRQEAIVCISSDDRRLTRP